MGREIRILWAGRHRRESWESLCADYRKRIGRFMTISETVVKTRGKKEEERRRSDEAEALLTALPDPTWLIALDGRGQTMSSEALAKELARLKMEWPHPIVFVLGSDVGLDRSVLQRARRVLSFGPMIFSHEIARLMLYEQLYRGLSINAGINYHRPPL